MEETRFLTLAFYGYLFSTICYTVFFFKEFRNLRLFATGSMLLAALLHLAALIIRWVQSGHAPFTNMYESMIFFSFCFIAAYAIVEGLLKTPKLGFLVHFFNLALLVYAFGHDATIKPLMPALQSNWMLLHVITCFLSYGAFAVSFIASLFYLTPLKRFFRSDAALDRIMYQSILFGFPLLTLGVASGAVWANEAWGTYWSWDPKETWSLITWFIYALYLHLRLMKGWSGSRMAWFALGGFASVLFTYWGVSYLLSGLHSYA